MSGVDSTSTGVFVRLDVGSDGVSAAGYEICAEGDQRWAVRFSVELDAEWRRRHDRRGDARAGAAPRPRVGRRRVVAARWPARPLLGGLYGRRSRRQPVHEGAFVTRRVAPEVGVDVEVRAAYIETPVLSVRPLVQRYQRLAADRWVYADDEHGRFELSTDADGVAVDYEQLRRARLTSVGSRSVS